MYDALISYASKYSPAFQKVMKEFLFSQLPYLIDGDKKLTQSHVITMYLGKKHGLGESYVSIGGTFWKVVDLNLLFNLPSGI